MKWLLQLLGALIVVLLLALGGCIALDQIPLHRATPPPSVTDVASCLNWLKHPIDAYKITVGTTVYYQIRGPAGRYLPSGCSAYSFNQAGKFIGWTMDDGDIREPEEVYASGAKDEKIPLDELKKIFQH